MDLTKKFDQNNKFFYVPGTMKPEQLHNVLNLLDYKIKNEDLYRIHLDKENGKCADILFYEKDKGIATPLTIDEKNYVTANYDYKLESVIYKLGELVLSNIKVTDTHPETGEHQRGIGYVSADINGVPQPARQFGSQLFNNYVQGVIDEEKLAAVKFYPIILEQSRNLVEAKTTAEKISVKLTPNDIQSVLLSPEENKELEQNHRDRLNKLLKTLEPGLKEYHQIAAKVYDETAKECGFTQFDEHEDGEGIRNYTAQGKRKTPEIKKRLDDWAKLITENKELEIAFEKFHQLSEKRDVMMEEEKQRYFREILEITRPRMDKIDSNGKPILSTEAYNQMVEKMSDEERKNISSAGIMDTVYREKGDNAKTFKADKSIVPYLQRMIDAGYSSVVSCSGTLKDHPNYRYVEKNEVIGFEKGEAIYYNKQHNGAYIAFWEPDEVTEEILKKIGDKVNTKGQIEAIKKAAKESGWNIESSMIFFRPCLVLRLPTTYDGTSDRDILDESNDRTDKQFPGLQKDNFLDWLEKRTPIKEEVQKEHGGVVRYTDNMILDRWNKLTLAMEREREIQRISDIHIFQGGDGNWKMKCKIDGVQQLAANIPLWSQWELKRGMPEEQLAVKLFSENLKIADKMNQSVKR